MISTRSYRRYWLKSLEEIHADLFAAVARWVPQDAVVWDIGANLGVFAFAAALRIGRGGHVYAFEADLEMAALMALSLAARTPEEADVCICPLAIGAKNGEACFSVSGYRTAASALDGFGRFEANKDDRKRTVPMQTVDSLATWLRPPTLLKIDVEGAENLVLEGAEKTVRDHRPLLLLEASGAETGSRTVEILKGWDYVWERWDCEGAINNEGTTAW